MTQCSLARAPLPACLAALSGLLWVTPSLAAQVRYRVLRSAAIQAQPGSGQRTLGWLATGAVVAAGQQEQNGWVEVTLRGWIWARSVERTARDGFDLAVAVPGGENLRAEPQGTVLARLARGFLLREDGTSRQGWIPVRRTGWVRLSALELVPAGQSAPAGELSQASSPSRSRGAAASGAGSAPAAAPAGGPDAGRQDAASTSLLDYGLTGRQVEFLRRPEGEPAGSLAPETPVRILARSGGWVRVSAEGWIREGELRPAAPGVLVGVTGAEVRARPEEFQGKLVQWAVQYLALQTADELRPEIPAGQRYVLARGPLPEAGFVYLVPSAGQLGRIEQLQPLAELVIVGRIKTGRSQYLGNPVLELVDLAVRRPS